MSRNADKIKKALAEKGYATGEMSWTPVGHACEMCGPDGGWYIDVVLLNDREEYVDTILAYSTVEALEEIENLPDLMKVGDSHA
jgi:hypothetical protein